MKAYVTAYLSAEVPESLRMQTDELHGDVQHKLDAALEMAQMKLLEIQSIEVDMDTPGWHKDSSKKEADSNPAQQQASEALKVAKELSSLQNMLAGLGSRDQLMQIAGLQNVQESISRLYEYAEQMRAGQVQQLQMAAEYHGWDPEKLRKSGAWGADPFMGTPFSDAAKLDAIVRTIKNYGDGQYDVAISADDKYIVLSKGNQFALVDTLPEAFEAVKADYAKAFGQVAGDAPQV